VNYLFVVDPIDAHKVFRRKRGSLIGAFIMYHHTIV